MNGVLSVDPFFFFLSDERWMISKEWGALSEACPWPHIFFTALVNVCWKWKSGLSSENNIVFVRKETPLILVYLWYGDQAWTPGLKLRNHIFWRQQFGEICLVVHWSSSWSSEWMCSFDHDHVSFYIVPSVIYPLVVSISDRRCLNCPVGWRAILTGRLS